MTVLRGSGNRPAGETAARSTQANAAATMIFMEFIVPTCTDMNLLHVIAKGCCQIYSSFSLKPDGAGTHAMPCLHFKCCSAHTHEFGGIGHTKMIGLLRLIYTGPPGDRLVHRPSDGGRENKYQSVNVAAMQQWKPDEPISTEEHATCFKFTSIQGQLDELNAIAV